MYIVDIIPEECCDQMFLYLYTQDRVRGAKNKTSLCLTLFQVDRWQTGGYGAVSRAHEGLSSIPIIGFLRVSKTIELQSKQSHTPVTIEGHHLVSLEKQWKNSQSDFWRNQEDDLIKSNEQLGKLNFTQFTFWQRFSRTYKSLPVAWQQPSDDKALESIV